MHIASDLSKAEKLNLIRTVYASDLSPSAKTVAHIWIDLPNARLWSDARLAIAIRRSVRTVERVKAELRRLGFFLTVRRRRQTCIKVLCVERVLMLGKQGVEAAKAACAVAMSLMRRGNSLTRHDRRAISILDIKKADENAPWRVQGPAPDYLLRFMGLPTGERRR